MASSPLTLKIKPRRPKATSKRRKAVKAGYRSGFELDFAENLEVPFEYETEKLPYIVTRTHHYLPDFVFKKADGSRMYVELKGRFTASDRVKMREIKKQHPNLDIRMIFQMGTNRITKTSKTTYMMWCDKQNIPAYDCHGAIPRMPLEWINELCTKSKL